MYVLTVVLFLPCHFIPFIIGTIHFSNRLAHARDTMAGPYTETHPQLNEQQNPHPQEGADDDVISQALALAPDRPEGVLALGAEGVLALAPGAEFGTSTQSMIGRLYHFLTNNNNHHNHDNNKDNGNNNSSNDNNNSNIINCGSATPVTSSSSSSSPLSVGVITDNQTIAPHSNIPPPGAPPSNISPPGAPRTYISPWRVSSPLHGDINEDNEEEGEEEEEEEEEDGTDFEDDGDTEELEVVEGKDQDKGACGKDHDKDACGKDHDKGACGEFGYIGCHRPTSTFARGG